MRLENIVGMTDIVVTLMLSLTLGPPLLSYLTRQVPCSPSPPGASIQLPRFILLLLGRLTDWAGAHLVTTRDRLIREPAADKTNPAKETCHQN